MEDSLIHIDKVEHIFLTDLFEKVCPEYLAMGMSYEQFWRDDPTMVKFFKAAYNLNKKIIKYNIYEGGMYTYEALCKVSPVLHAFAKNGTKPLPFSEKPYGIEEIDNNIESNNKTLRLNNENQKQKNIENERLRAQIFFNNWYRATKKHFEQEAGEK